MGGEDKVRVLQEQIEDLKMDHKTMIAELLAKQDEQSLETNSRNEQQLQEFK